MKHRSKRDIPCSPIRRTSYAPTRCDCPNRKKCGCAKVTGILAPTFYLSCGGLDSASRSRLKRLLNRHHIEAEEIECRPAKDSHGVSITVPTVLKVWGLAPSLAILASFVDSTLGITAELATRETRSTVAAGSGALSQSAGRFARLNRHQQRETNRNPAMERQRRTVERLQREERDTLTVLRDILPMPMNSFQRAQAELRSMASELSAALKCSPECGRAIARRIIRQR